LYYGRSENKITWLKVSLTPEPTLSVITSVGFFKERLSLFLSLKVNLGGDKFKDDGNVDAAVT